MEYPEPEVMAQLLENSGDYLVLRRLDPKHWDEPRHLPPAELKRGIFCDVETTGLNAAEDDVIEFALVEFQFDRDGMIYHAREAYQGFQDSQKLSAEITELTGITSAMIAGQHLDLDKITEIVKAADLVISHHAEFDRKFAEQIGVAESYQAPVDQPDNSPGKAFREKAWACSMEQIPWQAEGIGGGRRLKYLAQEFGFFYDAHRATDDCWAGVEVLSRTLPKSGRPALGHLLEAARKPTWRVWAQNAPFKMKDAMKGRAYRWSSGDEPGMPLKSWYFDAKEEAKRDAEVEFLRRSIYGSASFDPRIDRITAYDRFAVRDWSQGNWLAPTFTP